MDAKCIRLQLKRKLHETDYIGKTERMNLTKRVLLKNFFTKMLILSKSRHTMMKLQKSPGRESEPITNNTRCSNAADNGPNAKHSLKTVLTKQVLIKNAGPPLSECQRARGRKVRESTTEPKLNHRVTDAVVAATGTHYGMVGCVTINQKGQTPAGGHGRRQGKAYSEVSVFRSELRSAAILSFNIATLNRTPLPIGQLVSTTKPNGSNLQA